MKTTFLYSVLQYKHSLGLDESLNVGVFYFFPDEKRVDFIADSPHRLKAVYPGFDVRSFNSIIKGIVEKVKSEQTLFRDIEVNDYIKRSIHTILLKEDSTALQFGPLKTSLNLFKSNSEATRAFAQLLLPGYGEGSKKGEIRHNEAFLVKRYTELVSTKDKSVTNKIKRDQVIKTPDLEVKFELAWQNGSFNYVKPLSFDLKDEQQIQVKSATYFSYLTLLNDLADANNYRFHLLVSKPQEKKLFAAYDKALNILHGAKSPKRIVEENQLEEYSLETVSELQRH